jgi:hypothetical protein
VGPVFTCGRGLLGGRWRPIGLMISFMIFTASVQNVLDTPTYLHSGGSLKSHASGGLSAG